MAIGSKPALTTKCLTFADRIGRQDLKLGNSVFLALEKRFDIDRRDQLAGVAKSDNLPTPVMRAAARLHDNLARRHFGEECEELPPLNHFAENRFAFYRRPMKLKTPF